MIKKTLVFESKTNEPADCSIFHRLTLKSHSREPRSPFDWSSRVKPDYQYMVSLSGEPNTDKGK